MTRILHLTDTHLGHTRPFAWARPDGLAYLGAQAAMQAALAPARRREVDLVVHTGDLFDRSQPPVTAVRAARRMLAEVAQHTPVVVVRGNHEWRGIGPALTECAPLLHVADHPQRLVLGGLALALVPHQRAALAWQHAAEAAVGPGVDLLCCHQSFEGAKVPGFRFRVGRPAETVGPQHLPARVEHILCGHIHPRQVVELGGTVVVHPGSTVPTSPAERGLFKGVARWTLGRSVRWRFDDLPGPAPSPQVGLFGQPAPAQRSRTS